MPYGFTLSHLLKRYLLVRSFVRYETELFHVWLISERAYYIRAVTEHLRGQLCG